MSTYGYTIVISSSTTREQIHEINNVMRQQFNDSHYECHLDHLMLFSTQFYNMNKRIYYTCIYVISLAPIKHSLFLTDKELDVLLENPHPGNTKSIVYSGWPSFRFNKFHNDDFFHLDDNNKIIIHQMQTNSNGLVWSA